MKFLFISGAIFLLISTIYLGYFCFLFDKSEVKKTFSKLVLCYFFPFISITTILLIIVYISAVYKDILLAILIILCLILIMSGIVWNLGYKKIKVFPTLITALGFIFLIIGIYTNGIPIEEKVTTETIYLYDSSVTQNDLSGIVINITSDSKGNDERIVMQCTSEDIKKYGLSTSIDCDEFKLITTDENRIEITKKEILKCNLFYHHGFTNFEPEIHTVEDSIKYILYINRDNIILE